MNSDRTFASDPKRQKAGMRTRNEWAMVLMVASLAIGALPLPTHSGTPIAARERVPAEGIDYTPIGSAHSIHAKEHRPVRK